MVDGHLREGCMRGKGIWTRLMSSTGPREFGPRDCDDIVAFLRSVLWLSVHQEDAWGHSSFLGRRVAAVHFLSEPVAMGEETTKNISIHY